MSEDPSPATTHMRGRTDAVEKKRARAYKRKHKGMWWPYSSAGLPGVPRLVAKEKIQHCTRLAVQRASASAQRIWKLHDSPIRQTELLLSISSFPSSAVTRSRKSLYPPMSLPKRRYTIVIVLGVLVVLAVHSWEKLSLEVETTAGGADVVSHVASHWRNVGLAL